MSGGVDKPITGLIQDLKGRGLLDETLVIWGGEFGRTPTAENEDGRDHNPHGFTMWLAGGGMKPSRRFEYRYRWTIRYRRGNALHSAREIR